jgi:hypothetical protein
VRVINIERLLEYEARANRRHLAFTLAFAAAVIIWIAGAVGQ